MRLRGRVAGMKHYGVVAGVMVVFSLVAPSSWGEQKCTHITIELNGAAVAAPQKITLLKTRGGTPIVVRVEDGCFQLPEKLWHSKSIDVIFQVDGDDIHLTGIRPSDFAVGWKLTLSDTAVGPFAGFKGVPAREICVLESDQGGDGTAEAQTGCRSAKKKTDGSPAQK
jgi:hypothetical protein